MLFETRPRTFAELVKLDLLIIEHKKLIGGAARVLQEMNAGGFETAQGRSRLKSLRHAYEDFIVKREVLRKHLTHPARRTWPTSRSKLQKDPFGDVVLRWGSS
jgi:hypothetical protein